MRYILLIFVGIVLTPLFLYASYGSILWILGYEFSEGPDVLAEKLINEKRPAKDCFLYRTLDLGPRPTTYELQMECVYEYASLTLDPTACELLLPSDYGWSCLGAVEEKLFLGDPCYYSPVRDDVYCNKNYSEGELTIEHPQMDNCSLYQRNDLREWCHYERTLTSKDVHECDSITHPVVYDNCEYSHALKLKDLSFCSPIKDPSRRSFCEFRVKMAVKYSGKRFSAVQ